MSDLPPLTPQTRRIHDLAERLGQTPLQITARADLAFTDPDRYPEPPDPLHLDPDPASMLRLKTTSEPVPLERPDATEDQIKGITPQFFLRNTHRAERYADPDWLEYERLVYDEREWRDLGARQRAIAQRPPTPELSSQRFAIEVAERGRLMVETRWHEHFGRPDPSEPLDD